VAATDRETNLRLTHSDNELGGLEMPTNVQQRHVRPVPAISPNSLGVVAILLASVVALALLASLVDMTATAPPLSEAMLWAL
jgi:hypothetical protein